MKVRIVFAFVAAIIAITVAYAQQQQDPKVTLAQTINDLGACQAQLGQLNQLRAQVVVGNLVDLQTVKADFEAANPTLVLDTKTWAATAKPVAGPTGTTGKGRGGR